MSKTFLWSVFHCNLAFSLIPKEHFPDVIERCYTPLLDMCEEGVPLGIEMPAWTLMEVERIDPGFVERLSRLWEAGKCEFIGSGFSQAVFPLIPCEVNRWNLQAGNRRYEELLGRRPRVALVNEQTFSRGLVDLYKEAGYRAVIMDWNNPFAHNRFERNLMYRPQRAAGTGAEVELLWSNSIAFQKFQRCVHGELPEKEYMEYLLGHHSDGQDRAFPVYTNDAEVFDYRPGHEAVDNGEFERIRGLYGKLSEDPSVELATPSTVLDEFPAQLEALSVESPEAPVVTKKQGKYNPVRWAVTGRDSAHANTECHKVYLNVKTLAERGDISPERLISLKEGLCLLWASDFRTNTIDEKYRTFQDTLGWLKTESGRLLSEGASVRVARAAAGGFEQVAVDAPDGGCCAGDGQTHACDVCACSNEPSSARVMSAGGVLKVATDTVKAEFLENKGYAIKTAVFPGVSDAPLIGTMPHGYYEDIRLGADFFSGHLIHISREGAKTTDLVKKTTEPSVSEDADAVTVEVKMELAIGTLWKTYRVSKTSPEIELKCTLKVDGLTASSLRAGIFTVFPEAFDRDGLYLETVNGGPGPERFSLRGRELSHDKPVSPRVSSSGCLGATEGWTRVGDGEKYIEFSTDKTRLYSVPMVSYTELQEEDGRDFFLRIVHSLGETDDTAWWVWRGYNEISFKVRAAKHKE